MNGRLLIVHLTITMPRSKKSKPLIVWRSNTSTPRQISTEHTQIQVEFMLFSCIHSSQDPWSMEPLSPQIVFLPASRLVLGSEKPIQQTKQTQPPAHTGFHIGFLKPQLSDPWTMKPLTPWIVTSELCYGCDWLLCLSVMQGRMWHAFKSPMLWYNF